MAADLVQVSVEPKTKEKSSNVKSVNKEKKDKPSLFDQMISKNKDLKKDTTNTKNETVNKKSKEVSTVKTDEKVKISLFDKLTNVNKQKSKVEIDSKDIGKVLNDKNIDTKKPSLFDTLTKTNKEDIKSKIDTKNIDKTITELKANATATKKDTSDLSKKIKSDDLIKKANSENGKVETKEINKVETSLFDSIKETITSVETLSNKSSTIGDKGQNNKKETISTEIKTKTSKSSLMDNIVNSIKTKKDISIKEKDENSDITKEKLSAKSFLTNQETKATIISKHKLEESKKILLDDSIKDAKTKITKSAKTLELGESKVEITSEDKIKVETKTVSKIDAKVQEQTTFLNKVLFKQALNTQDLQKLEQTKVIKQSSEVEQSTSEIKSEDIQVKESANQTAIQHITNKIISARQNMKSFMSDMARKMYENYKPPVTSFKINLNPANLGSISIVMKSEKATNSISISLNTTNSSTLEVLEGAKGLLQNSLQKTFENQSNFSLDFSQNNDQTNTQDNSDNKNKKEEPKNKKEESQDIVENDISIDDGYM